MRVFFLRDVVISSITPTVSCHLEIDRCTGLSLPDDLHPCDPVTQGTVYSPVTVLAVTLDHPEG